MDSLEKTGDRISVVTPTLYRPQDVCALLSNLSKQAKLPEELILVDGAPNSIKATENLCKINRNKLPFKLKYLRSSRGTAIQRNFGIEEAKGEFIAFIDDDIRLESAFFENIINVFKKDQIKAVGGIVGYRTNEHFRWDDRGRWRWYRRLRLLTTYEPGRYDYQSGYPVNANMQPPFSGTREVDFMTTSCAIWRKGVFNKGLEFDSFFVDYGVLEDAHFSLRARNKWILLQCGDARCVHLHSKGGRVISRKIGYKSVVNYYYVFRKIVKPLKASNKLRFWRFQVFELIRILSSGLRRKRKSDFEDLIGRLQGMIDIVTGKAFR